jgi:pectate lyase
MTFAHVRCAAAAFSFAVAQACASDSAGSKAGSSPSGQTEKSVDAGIPAANMPDVAPPPAPSPNEGTQTTTKAQPPVDSGKAEIAPAAGSGGAPSAAAGGAGAPSTESSVDSEGCPINLEGFASVADETQNGTTGGAAGEVVTVTNQTDLTRYAEADEPYVIHVQGALTLAPKGKEILVASNKTIIGVGASAEIVEGGFNLGVGIHNVIIRNLTIHGTFEEGDWEGKTQDHDGVQMDTAHHIWIDHVHFHHIGDGMIDSRKDTSFVTVSWNVLSDHNKAFGIGWTENVTSQLTIHHNWFRDTNQRNPSTDNVLRAHLYNNWLERLASYGHYARGGTHMVLEHSVFDTVKDPHYYETGSLVAIDNEYIDSQGRRESTGTSYGVFDPHMFYQYTLTPTRDVSALLTRCAGPRATLGL